MRKTGRKKREKIGKKRKKGEAPNSHFCSRLIKTLAIFHHY